MYKKIVFMCITISCFSMLYAINIDEPDPVADVDTMQDKIEGGESGMMFPEAILRLVNNDIPADELINTVYPEEGAIKRYRLSHIMQKMPPECVRQINGGVYFVYKYVNENYLFVYYTSIEEDNYPMRVWYLGPRHYLKDFEKLANERAGLDNVRAFDPYGDYSPLYFSAIRYLATFHHTVDGYFIRLDYSYEIRPFYITEITIFYGEINSLYYNLLPIDKELIGGP